MPWKKVDKVRVSVGLVCSGVVACAGGVTEVIRSEEPELLAATPSLAEGTVLVKVTARNPNSYTIRYEGRSPCGVFLRFYQLGGDPSAPAWDQLDWFHEPAGGCKWLPVVVTLQPGEASELTPSAEVERVLGDSLASGTYRVSAVVAVAAPELALREIEAGAVELEH